MNSEMYIKDMKERFYSAKEWANEEIKQHFEAYENGYIGEINDDYVLVLRSCDTWEEALEIANNWII